ncbi:unnamed protein product [Bursaphelenchus xylophilus]|uniref:(pine wood nematode) hypothetical protein n=1 Tax=Bursaphelenchus xylophilus TaxID=6326 RepID=A0A7I8X576_BURXY|nr:unnamed protein product [Bursaphelenchus xylophilus]CAG9122517.1 unnamed protein product [Bursaphelenchus xylophilus]
MYGYRAGARRHMHVPAGRSPPKKRCKLSLIDNQSGEAREAEEPTLNEKHFDDAFAGFGDLDFSGLQRNLGDDEAGGLNDIVVIRKPITEEDRAKTNIKLGVSPRKDKTTPPFKPVNETIVLDDYTDTEESNDVELVEVPLTEREKAANFFSNVRFSTLPAGKKKGLNLEKPLLFNKKKKRGTKDDDIIFLPSPPKASVISAGNSNQIFLSDTASKVLTTPWHNKCEEVGTKVRRSARIASHKAISQVQSSSKSAVEPVVTQQFNISAPTTKTSGRKAKKKRAAFLREQLAEAPNDQPVSSQEPMEVDPKPKEEAMDVDLENVSDDNRNKQGMGGKLRRCMVPAKKSNPLPPNGVPISVCTYNVLCESTRLRCEHLYKSCDESSLPWSVRWKKLCKFFRENYADIYCIQEVEEKYVTTHFRSFFSERGFGYIYTARGNGNPDGCMIAYNLKELKRIEGDHEHIFYNHKVDGFNKDNVGQLLRFEHLKSGLRFNVINTHILFNMRRGDLKLGQLIILLNRIHENTNHTDPKFVGNIVCGDFNMDPRSLLYDFVRQGILRVSKKMAYHLALSPHKCMKESKYHVVDVKPSRIGLTYNCTRLERKGFVNEQTSYSHPMKFLSAYEHRTEKGQPEVSTRHLDFGCPDFIFYQGVAGPGGTPQEDRIQLFQRLRLPSLGEIDKLVGPMPNQECGSDHLPLLAEFVIS